MNDQEVIKIMDMAVELIEGYKAENVRLNLRIAELEWMVANSWDVYEKHRETIKAQSEKPSFDDMYINKPTIQ